MGTWRGWASDQRRTGSQRVGQFAARGAFVQDRHVKHLELAILVMQVELERSDAPIQLHVERRVCVIPFVHVALRLGRVAHVIAVVRAD